MPWIRRTLRDKVVYVKTTNTGQIDAGRDGRVDIRYQPSLSAKKYRAAVRNLEETGNPEDNEPIELEGSTDGGDGGNGGIGTKGPLPGDAIVIYTDGACTGNPGPAGLGVVIIDGNDRKELSEYLGSGTNNIAELTAIERALEAVWPKLERTVVIHSDSSYSIGLMTKGWKAKANTELVGRMRELARGFADLRFVKVKGHAGIPENERCDELARESITRRQ